MSIRRCSGQAAAEYVAVLLLVGAVLAAAAASTFAVPGVGAAVVRTVRVGICIVGGDLCRTADAAAAGLAPCATGARSARQETSVDIGFVRLGGHGEWELAVRSDGSATVTRLAENDVGGIVGIGPELGGFEADVETAAVARYRAGKAWRFPDVPAAERFLAAAMHGDGPAADRPPDVRWDDLEGRASGEAGVALADLAGAGLSIGASSAVGLRRDGDVRTITLDLGLDGFDLSGHLPGFPPSSGGRQALVAEVTWEGGSLRELALRTATADEDVLEETTARVDLREDDARALAERLLRPGTGTDDDVQAVLDHAAAHGVVERSRYRTSERRRGLSAAARLGLSLGFSHERITATRRLVDAVASIRGGPPVRRMDCLGA